MAKSTDSLPEKSVNRNTVDANNNSGNSDNCPQSNLEGTTVVKYQLRPRSSQPRRWNHYDWNFQERVKHNKSRQQQPLSRYRRKTANARERFRMRQINTAFENLRGVLPPWVCSRRSAADLTKITTLKLASAYIRTLQDVLDGKTQQEDSPFYKLFPSDIDESCGEERMSPLQRAIDGSIYHQISQSHVVNETELVTFLRGASDAGVVPANLESLSCLAPVSEDDPVTLLLLECDPIQSWDEGQEVPMVL